ncbi:MAG: Na+/H+ antiporter subunit D, partial [Propioniciclava sp.]|nr:Na+/H+ antiporter subunit D [Propioniciclava sp.]
LIQRVGGSSNLDRLSGLMTTSPLLAALFIVPGMNLAGIPPFSGFIGKLGLLSAGVRAGTPLAWALVAASVVTSLLTLYAIAKVWNRAFWGTPIAFTAELDEGEEETYPGRPMPAVMVTATLGLIAFSLLLTLVAGPFYAYTNNAAAALLDGAYARAVIGEVVP